MRKKGTDSPFRRSSVIGNQRLADGETLSVPFVRNRVATANYRLEGQFQTELDLPGRAGGGEAEGLAGGDIFAWGEVEGVSR